MIFPLFLLSCFLHTARTGKSQSSLPAVRIEIQYCLKVTATKEGNTWYVFLIITRSMTFPFTRTLSGFILRSTSKIFLRWGRRTVAALPSVDWVLQVSDQDFSITLDAYFNVKWEDRRLQSAMFSNRSTTRPTTRQERRQRRKDKFSMTAVNVNILPKLWIPDLEIMDLMSFETHEILSKLEGKNILWFQCSIFVCGGVWIDSNYEVMYALASKITFICQMDFNAFPVDIQVSKKLSFLQEFWPGFRTYSKYCEGLQVSCGLVQLPDE